MKSLQKRKNKSSFFGIIVLFLLAFFGMVLFGMTFWLVVLFIGFG